MIDRHTYEVIEHHSNDSLGWTAIKRLGPYVRRHETFTSRRAAMAWIEKEEWIEQEDYDRYRTAFISSRY